MKTTKEYLVGLANDAQDAEALFHELANEALALGEAIAANPEKATDAALARRKELNVEMEELILTVTLIREQHAYLTAQN